MIESRQRGQEVINNLEIYEKKSTEAEAETVSLNWGTPDILICTDPFVSWWLQMPWCQTGARSSTSTKNHVTSRYTQWKKTLGRQPVVVCFFLVFFFCFFFCQVCTLMVIILYVTTILQTTFSNAFSGTKIVLFWFRNHWNLCPIKNYPAWCHFLN